MWCAALKYAQESNHRHFELLAQQVDRFSIDMREVEMFAHFEFCKDFSLLAAGDYSSLVQVAITRYLMKRFPWQQSASDLLTRTKQMVITEEMIRALRSPPKERQNEQIETPNRIKATLRKLR